MLQHDRQFGQLALARGWVSLANLMTCVAQAAAAGLPLDEVFVRKGLLTQEKVETLRTELASGAKVDEELEFGNTVVLEVLEETRRQSQTLAVQPSGDGGDALLHLDGEARYAVQEELGRGGMGLVMRARDRVLRRDVAIKSLLESADSPKFRNRLLAEAQVTGLLEHPNITPVYDLRVDSHGKPFYTMRVVRERDMGDILKAMKSGDESYSLTFLMQVLRQVSLTIEFAHRQGVVHRDLKPENILVGSYGEVYVIDWGIAKLMKSDLGLVDTEQIVVGSLIGTPKYMAPEQARGDNDKVDERTDVYALGAILYEILTLESLFTSDHVLGLLFMIVHDQPVSPREKAPKRAIPPALEEICLRALAKDPTHRYASAQAFSDELELFLEGVKDRDRRRALAEDSLQLAEQTRAVFDEIRLQHRVVKSQLEETRKRVPSWSTGPDKVELWSLEQAAEDLEVDIERRFSETVRMYSEALVHWPDMGDARHGLANLYWQRFEEAEAAGNMANAVYLEGLVRQFNDGALDSLLEGTGKLTLVTEPAGVKIELYRYHQENRRLVEWLHATLTSPVAAATLSHGSYVAVLSKPGFQTVRLPIAMGRVDVVDYRIRMMPIGTLPEDFIPIPASYFKRSDGEVFVDDFAIMRTPVTVGEYLEFLNSIPSEEAERHVPRLDEESEAYFARDATGIYGLPEVDGEGDVWEMSWPMLIVNYDNAEAFAQWRSTRDGKPYRLPTAMEWEKAARGVDGRIYPWGNHFDATFCCMRDSRQGRRIPSVVGEFSVDTSPYGVQDVAGNVAQWTSSPPDGGDDRFILKGASYNSVALMCQVEVDFVSPRQFRYGHYGFRLALTI